MEEQRPPFRSHHEGAPLRGQEAALPLHPHRLHLGTGERQHHLVRLPRRPERQRQRLPPAEEEQVVLLLPQGDAAQIAIAAQFGDQPPRRLVGDLRAEVAAHHAEVVLHIAGIVAVVAPVVPDAQRHIHREVEEPLPRQVGRLLNLAQAALDRGIAPLAGDDGQVAALIQLPEHPPQPDVVRPGRFGRPKAVGMDGYRIQPPQHARLAQRLQVIPREAGGRRPHHPRRRVDAADGGDHLGGDGGVGLRVGRAVPELVQIRLVPDLPDDARIAVVGGGPGGEAGEGGAALRRRVRRIPAAVEIVAVVEDEDEADAVLRHRLHQRIVGAEVVLPPLTLHLVPEEIHPHEADAQIGQARHLLRGGTGEVDVDPPRLRHDRLRQHPAAGMGWRGGLEQHLRLRCGRGRRRRCEEEAQGDGRSGRRRRRGARGGRRARRRRRWRRRSRGEGRRGRSGGRQTSARHHQQEDQGHPSFPHGRHYTDEGRGSNSGTRNGAGVGAAGQRRRRTELPFPCEPCYNESAL